MDSTFPLFTQFPGEVRQHIKRWALAQSWSTSQPQRARGNGLRLVGEVQRAVGQACREARDVMQSTHTLLPGLGWIDFGRHLFLFRDASAMQAATRCGLLGRAEHAVVNPRDWPGLWLGLDALKGHCAALRSLAVVAPWHDPAAALDAAAPDAVPDALHVAPYEDWGSVSAPQTAPLLAALHRPHAEADRLSHYRARLDRAVQLAVPDGAHDLLLDNAYGRTRLALQRLEQTAADLPGPTPGLYLRTRQELLSGAETQA